MGRAEDLENPEEHEEESGSSGLSGAGMKGVVEGVEELQLSATLTEKEQLRYALPLLCTFFSSLLSWNGVAITLFSLSFRTSFISVQYLSTIFYTL